ncbi:MAG: ATP-dependent helicase HrpB [Alphaproteobacteria bacterium]|nr:ATP-dependent helicase HrpB [Alphaproteobacteria bacterium]
MLATGLPIEDVLPQLVERLNTQTRLLLTAPPGAGKTTLAPLALIEQPWAKAGKLLVVEPRRLAARKAAERMAFLFAQSHPGRAGDRLGANVGLRSRLDVRTSESVRIEVVTEGVFTRMILADPALEGVAGVMFDEFHERSLDADEGLALALDAQSVLREDLRIIVMSATLPPNMTRDFFDADTIASDGRTHPVETRYLGFDPSKRLEEQVAAAIQRAVSEEAGSILAFLPGVAEIRRTADRLSNSLPEEVIVAPLHGALPPEDQNDAIAPPAAGARKVVLATDIAESSLTIEGVRIVVDGGFARAPRFDAATGVSRLETMRISLASADQRRGRAGRTQPGVCYRLWREAEMGGFAAARSPEIENADLSGLCLDLARWGVVDPAKLRWLTPPSKTAWRLARDALMSTGAIDETGALTDVGRKLGDIGLPPRLAMMVARADPGDALLAAEIAAVMSERDLGGRLTDIDARLSRFRADKSPRARTMHSMAKRWAREAGGGFDGTTATSAGEVLAAAFPERIAKARGATPGRFLLASGRGAMMDETDPLARAPWLAVADLTGSGADLRITLAASLDENAVVRVTRVETEERAHYDPASTTVRARRLRRIGAIVIEDVALPSPPAQMMRAGLVAAIQDTGFNLIPQWSTTESLIARVDFLAATVGEPWPKDFRSQLLASLDDWLGPLLESARSLERLPAQAVADAARALLDWPLSRDLDRLAPANWTTPAGRTVMVDYRADGGPRAECRVQEVYGITSHPMLADRTPLTLALLSPAQRPVAVTRDLPGFWRGGYLDMRRDMKGRYPKHDWPDDPATALPASRTRRQRS